MKLSVIIPVYNEVATMEMILSAVQAVPLEKTLGKEIIVVDDASIDGTREVLERIGPSEKIRVLRHERNQGKGAALRTGFRAATGDLVVIQDADLEYDPAEYPRLIEPILAGRADVVYGSRFAGRPPRRGRRWHTWGNRLLTWLSNRFTGLRLTDMETCHKVFRREILQAIEIEENRFGVEPELTAKLARTGCRFCEVPIDYQARSYAEGKKIGWKDVLRAVWCIVKYNRRRKRK